MRGLELRLNSGTFLDDDISDTIAAWLGSAEVSAWVERGVMKSALLALLAWSGAFTWVNHEAHCAFFASVSAESLRCHRKSSTHLVYLMSPSYG